MPKNIIELGADRLDAAPSFLARYRNLPAAAHQVLPGRVLSAAQTLAFGDFLQAVRAAFTPGGHQAASGISGLQAEDGAFMVEAEIADALLARTYEVSVLARQARRLPLGAGKREAKINAPKDDNRTTGARWGGVKAHWTPEGETLTPERPKFRQMKLTARQLTGLLYATSELVEDAVTLGAVIAEAFPAEFAFLLDDAIFEGDGALTPLGFLNGPGKITIAKETGQAAATILFENAAAMMARLPVHSIPTAEWWVSETALPKVAALHQVIGTGGVPAYLPASSTPGSRFGTLLNLPVRPIEYASVLGTEGDISLVDPTAYIMCDRMQFASSIHVAFDSDQQAFRFNYYVDGQPIDGKPLTPFKGGDAHSTFIVLATRA